jgi:hypothetical protein
MILGRSLENFGVVFRQRSRILETLSLTGGKLYNAISSSLKGAAVCLYYFDSII